MPPNYGQPRPYAIPSGWGTAPRIGQPNQGYAPAPQAAWSPPPAAQTFPTYPTARGQMPDEAGPAPGPARASPVRIPAPGELGIAGTRSGPAVPFDWSGLESRLRQLRAICYDREKMPEGCWRLTCVLPGRRPGQNRRVEARAENQAEAARLLLVKAEEWAVSLARSGPDQN